MDDIINDTEKNIDSASNNNKETICSICLEDTDDDKNLVITECKHKYHLS